MIAQAKEKIEDAKKELIKLEEDRDEVLKQNTTNKRQYVRFKKGAEALMRELGELEGGKKDGEGREEGGED